MNQGDTGSRTIFESSANRRWQQSRRLATMIALLLATAACGDDPEATSDESGDAADTEVESEDTEEDDADSSDESATTTDAIDEVTITYSSNLGVGSGLMQVVEWWADEIESRSEGAITVNRTYDAALFGATDVFEAVVNGEVDMAFMTAAYNPSQLPLWQLSAVPFQTLDSQAHTQAWLEMYNQNPTFREQFEEQGVVLMHLIPLGGTVVGTPGEVSSLEDLRGSRIRALGNIAAAFEAVGANPVNVPGEEVYQALQRGVVDGYSSIGFDLVTGMSLYEVAPVTTVTDLGIFTSVGSIANAAAWNDLPEPTRALIQGVNEDLIAAGVEILANAQAATCEQLLQTDEAQVNILPESENEEWQNLLGSDLVEDWVDDTVAAGVPEQEARSFADDLAEKIEQFEASSTYAEGMRTCAEEFEGM